MIERTILLFPECEHMRAIEDIRHQYDPLDGLVKPHITLVFPFESNISLTVLQEHVASIVDQVPAFPIRLQGVTGAPGGYLFLNVKEGNDRLIDLHDHLYSGILANYLCRKHTYIPHMTVGRLTNPTEWEEALQVTAGVNESFSTVIHEIWIETIGEGGRSILEWKRSLRQPYQQENLRP